MLRSLDIRDMLIIDRLELAFRPGLNVLTGETGAGKSILLDSLGFVLGWRGRADLVRTGAAQGEVVAVFELPAGHPAREVLAEAGLEAGDELILRRVNSAEGRKTAWVNDRRVSGEVLRALSDTLVELHGQQDDRGLLNPRGHRQLLDAFGGLDAQLDAVRAAWRARSRAERAVAEAEARLAALRAEEDFLRHAVAEMTELSPLTGEEAELDARRRTMQAAERIREDITRAHAALGPGEGAEGRMGDALRWLEGAADRAEGRLDTPLAALSRALIELGEAVQGVEDCLEALDFDPGALEAAEERLFAIRALARKHGVLPDDLGRFAEDLQTRLAALDAGEGDLAGQRRAAETARAAFDAAAAALSEARRAAAVRLDAAMAGELAPLKMERAVFSTGIAEAEPGPEGRDAVAFTVATNPGAPAGPLNRIASGGELSRFLLALKVCLVRGASPLTLIFDEIDRGVGGATADAVGRRLAALAGSAQVLVVTHSPQVAAQGDHHWRVEKRVEGDVTLSTVTPLDAAARVDEIARMMSGDTVTDAARAAARALLSS
ncbi:DNA repair protein RecN [Rhodovulum sp. BSW8]|uniref:DNA repair protein RecN n=1 Tax=Rhodovulum visakhapatnamense TaxID=364297 RepID=A0ABS1RLM9_9RHOB|nr:MULTISPECIES: DNA repair protein RecN [Rhodovulum]MBL3568471.1 DNA repair protein RecN [Rhodovulum visakhapatnamense]MBL3580568.1 DNA repair protein RecN [Rhodovulum visakhapatnamense]OLS45654.1 DNA repair protein RecN [Rhodovulum sulfidophilum]RBO54847.1 DNA repair protein RecN [Rhodovulum sp. BSW8]